VDRYEESYLSAYEDGTDSVLKRWHIKFRRQVFGHIVWYSFIDHGLILRSDHNGGLFCLLSCIYHHILIICFLLGPV